MTERLFYVRCQAGFSVLGKQQGIKHVKIPILQTYCNEKDHKQNNKSNTHSVRWKGNGWTDTVEAARSRAPRRGISGAGPHGTFHGHPEDRASLLLRLQTGNRHADLGFISFSCFLYRYLPTLMGTCPSTGICGKIL